jgi:aspartate carbamoyltransferase catalytic subunit
MDVLSIRDLSKEEVAGILDLAEDIHEGKTKPEHHGKILVTAFFEASTRTKLSFQSAAERNGMQVIDFLPELSSLKKGESFLDTIRTIEGYGDVLAIRHPTEGSVRLAADTSKKPVLNGGDGANQHPTQTLIDLFSIRKIKGKIEGLNVSLVGDLKHARTMRSLVYGLSMFGANITLISPKGLELPTKDVDEIKKKFNSNITIKQELDFSDADVLYVCRIQEERFADPYEAKRVKDQFMIKKENLLSAKEDIAILHPLPKINEIEEAIDEMPQAKYFEQAHYGVPIRQAVIDRVLTR